MSTMRRVLLFVFAPLVLAALLGASRVPPAAGVDIFETPGWEQRPYRVYTPSDSGSEPRAVVLILHGGGGDLESAVRSTQFDPVAEAHGFLAVYPSGVVGAAGRFRTWNAGNCCGTAMENDVDDVAYLRAVVADLSQRVSIDPARIYATGHSNGAMMSWRLACEAPDLVAAVAPVAGVGPFENCAGGRPVPVLHLHGTADRCATYEPGVCGGCFQDVLRAMGIPAREEERMCWGARPATRAWALNNACSTDAVVTARYDAVTCETYQGCAAGGEVTLCTIAGGGHAWPSRTEPIQACVRRPRGRACRVRRDTTGPRNEDIEAAELIWEFFNRHAM